MIRPETRVILRLKTLQTNYLSKRNRSINFVFPTAESPKMMTFNGSDSDATGSSKELADELAIYEDGVCPIPNRTLNN